MSITEPGLSPDVEQAMRDELAPDERTAEQAKADAREKRADRVYDEVDETATLPEADQAPNPDAPAEITASDEAGLAALHASTEAEDPIIPTLEQHKGSQLADLRRRVRNTADTTDAGIKEADARVAADFTPGAIQQPADILAQQQDRNQQATDIYQNERRASLEQAAAAQEAKHTANEPLWNKFKNLFKRGESKTGGEN